MFLVSTVAHFRLAFSMIELRRATPRYVDVRATIMMMMRCCQDAAPNYRHRRYHVANIQMQRLSMMMPSLPPYRYHVALSPTCSCRRLTPRFDDVIDIELMPLITVDVAIERVAEVVRAYARLLMMALFCCHVARLER